MSAPERGLIVSTRIRDASGKHRPVLIVSPKFLNGGLYVTAVPFTSAQLDKRKTQQTCVFFASGEFGLDRDCVAKTDNISQFKISELNIGNPIGQVSELRLKEVSKALKVSLGIDV